MVSLLPMPVVLVFHESTLTTLLPAIGGQDALSQFRYLILECSEKIKTGVIFKNCTAGPYLVPVDVAVKHPYSGVSVNESHN